jgi:hypothetical protein
MGQWYPGKVLLSNQDKKLGEQQHAVLMPALLNTAASDE